ncbi:5,5'-dehydrodivanillate O-demethylase oxygenase subunit [Paraburkholderia domus]|jgi:Phenylpropionate dioxygenase and related ring-hydroxylating dioxygenases, large terminal subunit|uniref:Rieske 2Fe-2S domain-containing protein n=1 Tax=Paraburkholderia domus TaxID=2793075 RepID=UPI0019149227|nr:Rieske 2Fe-2S domain-containing protein [Paraburkholderia domus]MBK5054576.1 Rieske 2Fe-2S domain-containing protein [Burkholderia sp. R-70006]MBK5091668.1 Rieske 2Fe-2S domain-containing protein [Burkholderia sp. R-69927]MBK5124856.1 Rieske 2Fe-2S domain-containing protein [Burkholderia sp. R-69980]MBK5185958.1 Rieske 2Fe-2S domain-containing protein [Burkholderia sp. R-69749]CAE6791786.1 5,5'-dehydrodivanillate O-demethylase oxygenase subunit [Paraburkholderia domus]
MDTSTHPITIKPRPRGADRYQYLTQTNAGTPAGELLRRYWQPVALIDSLPAGAAPQPIRIMGEDLVLFRDEDGRVGLIDRKCAHRCTDLALGRIESGGIRCPYHGWLFDVNGRCLDQPAEASATAKDRIRMKSYPLHEAAGAFWAYMGPGEPPLFPNYPALAGGSEYRYTTRWFGDCNWMQASEGNIDPVHTSYLHQLELSSADMQARWGVFSNQARPELAVEDTRFGVRLYTLRKIEGADRSSIRITNFVMPNACAVGGFEGYLGDGGVTMLWDVPIDDEHHWRWEFIFHRSGKLDKAALEEQYESEKAEGDRMRRAKDDLYSQDRASMERQAYLGLGECFSVHDIAITQSQGTIHEQSGEHLSSSDIAIVRARRMLDEAAQVVAEGGDPRGVVRDLADNDFRDMVVITGEIGTGESKEAYCAGYSESAELFTLQPTTA